MTVCDLCNEEIPDGTPDEAGSLTHGYIAHRVESPKTKHAWLRWPPSSRERKTDLRRRMADPEQFLERAYDFHAECILRLVEDAVLGREAAS